MKILSNSPILVAFIVNALAFFTSGSFSFMLLLPILSRLPQELWTLQPLQLAILLMHHLLGWISCPRSSIVMGMTLREWRTRDSQRTCGISCLGLQCNSVHTCYPSKTLSRLSVYQTSLPRQRPIALNGES